MVGSLMGGWNSDRHGRAPKGFEEEDGEERMPPHLRARLSLTRASAPVLSRSSKGPDPIVSSPKGPTTPRMDGGTPKKEGDTPKKATDGAPPEPYRWWTKVDSFRENEPYEEDTTAWKMGSYTPQKDIARVHVNEKGEPML